MARYQALSQSSKGHYIVYEYADMLNKASPSLPWQVRFICAFLIPRCAKEDVIDSSPPFSLFSLGCAHRIKIGSMPCVTFPTVIALLLTKRFIPKWNMAKMKL